MALPQSQQQQILPLTGNITVRGEQPDHGIVSIVESLKRLWPQ
jgi:hypothetical protein